ncbi:unnamed protein product [Arctogadus glacialis]
MAAQTLHLACVAVCLLLTGSTLVAGKNFSVPCDLADAVQEITWFHLHGERVTPLLSLSLNRMNRTSIETYHPRAVFTGDLRDQPPSLNLIEVNRSDAGLYFCVGRERQLSVTSRVLRLSVEEPEWPPCWILRAVLLPASALLNFLVLIACCIWTGKRCCCCRGKTEAGLVDYASIKHAHRPRPSAQQGPGLVKENIQTGIIYAAVRFQSPPPRQ